MYKHTCDIYSFLTRFWISRQWKIIWNQWTKPNQTPPKSTLPTCPLQPSTGMARPININISWQIALIPQWSVSIFTGTVSPVQRLKYPIWRALCFVSPADLISNKTMMCRDGKHTQGYLVHQCQDVQSSLTKQNQGLNLRKKNCAAFLKTFRSV